MTRQRGCRALHRGSAMIRRTVEISQKPAHLSVRLDQLLIQPHDAPEGVGTSSIPCEDLGILVVDHGQCTYSHHALARIAEYGGVLVVCGRDHLPAAVLLPLADHNEVVWRINDQLGVSRPLRKQLWRKIVQTKIRAQAGNLPRGDMRSRLLEMAREVRSGDPTNMEAQAAKLYWSGWLAHQAIEGVAPKTENCQPTRMDARRFRRDPDGTDPLNVMLNYGYAVLRATVARAIIGAGLLPAIGIHHSSRSNPFCLADDLVEPLRPIVDRRVRQLYVTHGRRELNQPTKAGILQVLGEPVATGDENGPLMVAIQRMVVSFLKCLRGMSDGLSVPMLPAIEESEAP